MAEHAATHTSRYKSTVFKSRLEARYAAFFDLAGWAWEYEPLVLDGWTPNFKVTFPCGHSECGDTHVLLVEVKPYSLLSDFEGRPGTKYNWGWDYDKNVALPFDASACFGINPKVSLFMISHGSGGGEYGIPDWVGNWEELWKAAKLLAAKARTTEIDPSNYVADLIRQLRRSALGDAKTKKELATFMKAVHFVCDPYTLPAAPTQNLETAIRPPYPLTSIAFESPDGVPVVIFCRPADLLDKAKTGLSIFNAVGSVDDVLVLCSFVKAPSGFDQFSGKWLPVPVFDFLGYTKNSNAKFDTMAQTYQVVKDFDSLPVRSKTAFADASKNASLEVHNLFSALATTHTEEVIQQASPKNNRRILDGKLPIWEVKTLVLKTPVTRTVSEYQGGTHASPRQHIRRGHYRHYKSGKIAWVRDCIVGSLEKGFVHKDYRVEPAAAYYHCEYCNA